MVSSITKQQTRGVTLLEVVIYLALFSLLMTGVIQVVYQLLRSASVTEHNLVVQTEGNFILQKLESAFSGSATVTLPDAETCIIARPDIGEGSPLVFSVQNDRLYLARGSSDRIAISSAAVRIHSVVMNLTNEGVSSVYFWVDDELFHFISYPYE